MKKNSLNAAFSGLIILLILVSCKKEIPTGYSTTNPNSPATPDVQSSNSDLKVSGGQDIWLILPVNHLTVEGGASGKKSGIITYTWRKVSGPASCSIVSTGNQVYLHAHLQYLLPETEISELEKGIYEFEVALSYQKSLPVKDTIVVTVGQLSANPTEKVIDDLNWIFPWYNSIEIKGFNRLIPPGNVFKIFIKRDNSNEWQEVLPFREGADVSTTYDYFVETRPDGAGIYNFGSLYIFYYGNDVSDTPSVKIIF